MYERDSSKQDLLEETAELRQRLSAAAELLTEREERLLEVQEERIRFFVSTRHQVLQIRKESDVVMDRSTLDESLLIGMNQVEDDLLKSICQRL